MFAFFVFQARATIPDNANKGAMAGVSNNSEEL
jgi:hypothetical protein